MTFEVQYDSILSRELHVLVHDATEMPVIINDPMITEMHLPQTILKAVLSSLSPI